MKKVFSISLVVLVFWACKDQGHSGTKEMILNADKNENTQVRSSNLILNNGIKWKADLATNQNVNDLILIIDAFKNERDKSLAAYQRTTADLQKELDNMISECKMQGPEHEALHMWLLPLMESVSEFKNSSTEANAAQLFEAISNQVNLFSQYFE